MRQIALDTETTGLSTKNGDRLVEIGCVEIINRTITGRTFHSYCNPERSVGQQTIEITGITDQLLLDKPKFVAIADDFLQFLDGADELIIHNASFDVEFINNEFKLANHKITDLSSMFKVTDSLALARKMHPGQRNNLDALCKRYNINVERTLHGALLDANILAKLILKMTAGQISLDFNLSENLTDSLAGYFNNCADSLVSTKTNNQERQEKKIKIIYANHIEQQLDIDYMTELLKS